MNITEITMANPSRISLPVYGRAFGMPVGVIADQTCGVVRDIAGEHRVKSAFTAVLTQGAFPGTTAWRPPIC